MQEMIKSIYEAVSDIVLPFKTLYPYQDIEADVDTGVVTFAPVKITNLTLAGERLLRGLPNSRASSEESEFAQAGEQLQTDNSLLVDSVTQVSFQVDIYKSINWKGTSEASPLSTFPRIQGQAPQKCDFATLEQNKLNHENMSAFDMAERLQTYLKSSQARDKFYNDYKYELMPVWADITFQADFNTYKKWVQIAQFEIFITKMSSIILSDKPLKNVVVSVAEINTLEDNNAYSNFADRFLKTN